IAGFSLSLTLVVVSLSGTSVHLLLCPLHRLCGTGTFAAQAGELHGRAFHDEVAGAEIDLLQRLAEELAAADLAFADVHDPPALPADRVLVRLRVPVVATPELVYDDRPDLPQLRQQLEGLVNGRERERRITLKDVPIDLLGRGVTRMASQELENSE